MRVPALCEAPYHRATRCAGRRFEFPQGAAAALFAALRPAWPTLLPLHLCEGQRNVVEVSRELCALHARSERQQAAMRLPGVLQ